MVYRYMFQFTPSRGGRLLLLVALLLLLLFQFTPSRGGRQYAMAAPSDSAYSFNSRPRAEGDSKSAQNASSVSRKNHQIAHCCANSLHKKLYLNRNIGQKHSEFMRRPLRVSAYDWGMRRVRQNASSHFRPAALPMKYRQTDSP